LLIPPFQAIFQNFREEYRVNFHHANILLFARFSR